jgi:hypothetical protein
LTVALKVAAHPANKPLQKKGFIKLATDGHGWTQILPERGSVTRSRVAV